MFIFAVLLIPGVKQRSICINLFVKLFSANLVFDNQNFQGAKTGYVIHKNSRMQFDFAKKEAALKIKNVG